MLKFLSIAVLSTMLAACGHEPAAVTHIKGPLPELMKSPAPLQAVPPADIETDPNIRAAYYTRVRKSYATLRDRHKALQDYVRAVTAERGTP